MLLVTVKQTVGIQEPINQKSKLSGSSCAGLKLPRQCDAGVAYVINTINLRNRRWGLHLNGNNDSKIELQLNKTPISQK